MSKFAYIASSLISAAALISASLLLNSCSNETPAAQETRTISISVGLSRPGFTDIATRTALSENDKGGLNSRWNSTDEVMVSDGTGILGTLKVDPETIENLEDGSSHAEFYGTLIIPANLKDNADFTFIYCGKNTTNSGGNVNADYYATQTGTLADLGDYDLLSSRTPVTITGNSAYTENMQLQRNVAFAHFKASGLDIPQSGVDITISGENIPAAASISYMNELTISPGEILVHADAEGDFYVAFPLADDNMHFSPTFTAKVGDKTYTCTLIREKAWTRGEYVREAPGKGITVEFTPVVDDDADADLVGPVFEVNGRKFRFLRANLAYNVPEKRWYLLDNQWSFLCKKGWAGKDGKWSAAKVDDIDLFAYGCTGLFFSFYNSVLHTPTQFDEQINAPEYFARESYYTSSRTPNATTEGSYIPTQNYECNQAYTGSNLSFHGIQDFPMDWGYAYGLQKNDGGHYFTLLSSEWTEIHSKHFICPATITDIKNTVTNKNGMYGCMILKAANLTDAKAVLKQYGATVSSSLSTLNLNGTTNSRFDYTYVKITKAQFEEMEKAGEVVFLPEAGHSSVTPGSPTKGDGYYWTATAGQQWNSYLLRFDGEGSRIFKMESITRLTGASVRLVKEIKE